MPTKLYLGGAIVALLIPFAATIAFMQFALHIVTKENSAFVGSLIGSFLAVGASTFIWLLSHWQKLQDSEKSKASLRKAIYVEAGALLNTAYDESLWWKERLNQTKIDITDPRVTSYYTAAVLDANLNRISELSAKAADNLIGLRAFLSGLRESVQKFYVAEDKIFELLADAKISSAEALRLINTNRAGIHRHFLNVAACALQSCRALDSSNVFLAERRQSYSAEVWKVIEEKEKARDAFLDSIIKQLRGRLQ